MTTFETSKDVEVQLPAYMKQIQYDGEETDFYTYGPIVACGFRPGTTELIIMDADQRLYELNAVQFFQSDDIGYDAYPIRGGQLVEFIRDDIIVTVDSVDLLGASQRIQLTNLAIGMKHEDQVIDIA